MQELMKAKSVAPGWYRDVKMTAVGVIYPTVAIYDTDGSSHDMAWLEATWGGPLDIRRAVPNNAQYVMRLTELRLHEGPCVQIVTTRGLGGEPLKCCVGRWWAGAPQLPEFPSNCIASRWHNNGLYGWTDAGTGVIGFGMGSGDMPGSSSVWPIHCDAPSDYVGNLGWMPGTNHKSIDVTFQVFEADGGGPEPTPSPPPETEGDYYLMVPVSLVKR